MGRIAVHVPLVALIALAPALLLTRTSTAAPAMSIVSKEYGYSVVVPASPANLVPTLATAPWTGGYIASGMPWFDTVTQFGPPRLYILSAHRLPAGSTLATWTTFFVAHRQAMSSCGAPATWSRSTLGGAPAVMLGYFCDGRSAWAYAVTAVHGGRGYFMIVATDRAIPHGADLRAFEQARRSFRWR
jgi:hypothetical protein